LPIHRPTSKDLGARIIGTFTDKVLYINASFEILWLHPHDHYIIFFVVFGMYVCYSIAA